MEKRVGGNVMVDGSIIILTGKTRLVHFGGNVSVTSSDSISGQSGISQDDNTQSVPQSLLYQTLPPEFGREQDGMAFQQCNVLPTHKYTPECKHIKKEIFNNWESELRNALEFLHANKEFDLGTDVAEKSIKDIQRMKVQTVKILEKKV